MEPLPAFGLAATAVGVPPPAGRMVNVNVAEALPRVAVITAGVLVLTADVFTVKFALEEPETTFTEPGTEAAEALLERPTGVSVVAVPPRLTVHEVVAGGVSDVELQVRLDSAGG